VVDVFDLPPPDWSHRPRPHDVRKALKLNERGLEALAAGDLARAQHLFEEAIEVDALLGVPWFNLGLIYKLSHRWPEAALCNRRSIEHGTSDQDPAFWNLGIAATAMRDWATARSAWTGYGVEVDAGEGPIEMDLGPVAIRLDPDGSGEVVWARRLDPARARIENIPMPGSGHHWNDIVLHDGEQRGERALGERMVPVFDELELWERSGVDTWECLLVGDDEAIDHLGDRFFDAGWAMEDWTVNVRRLCRQCSLGSVSPHKHGSLEFDPTARHVGIASPRQVAERLLDDWAASSPDRRCSGLYLIDD
jgi:hypothetical protein